LSKPPLLQLPLQLVYRSQTPEQQKVTATKNTDKPQKPAPKPAAAIKPVSVKPTKKPPESSKPQTNDLVVTPQSLASALEYISDLLDNLPLQACVELTRRLLTSIPFLSSGAARTWAVLKPVTLFVSEYGSTPWEDGSE
jgi:hypothetical protein